MSCSRFFFIVNPKAGAHLNVTAVRLLRDHLRSAGHAVSLELTRSLAHAGQLALHAADEGYDFLVVAGGDGTIRTVADALVHREITVIILPSGTENLLASELGIDGSLHTTINMIERGVTRNLDLGLANHRHFISVVGVGFDAEVVRRVHGQRSGHITHASYIWPICRTYWEYDFPSFHVVADGKILCDEPALIFVGNISRYAVGLKVMPGADCSDGLLDLVIYRCHQRRQLMMHSVLTVLGESHRSGLVTRTKCRSITIDSPGRDIPVQLDGDPGPNLPLKIEVIPSAAKVLTPPPPPGHPFCPPVRFYHFRRLLLR
jgi:diacylglycerol kinase (ATP)